MGCEFSSREHSVLYAMLAENTRDIILKTDRRGYIRDASPSVRHIGYARPKELAGWHLLDLVMPDWAAPVRDALEAIVAGRQPTMPAEVPLLGRDDSEHWFEMRIRGLADVEGNVDGALVLLHCVDDRKALEDRVFTAGMTDPLTGLTNRPAFMLMLQHLVERRMPGSVAVLSVDHFKAINLRHGQTFGDEVLMAFAEIVRETARSQDMISRIGGESLALLMPAATIEQARVACRRILAAIAEAGQKGEAGSIPITASAGVAAIEGTLDDTVRRAELALFFAKAKGGNRLESDGSHSVPAVADMRLAG